MNAPRIAYAGLDRNRIETEPQDARRVKRINPLGDLQTPEQIAQATALLCSAADSQLTGAVLLIERGCSLFQFDEGDD